MQQSAGETKGAGGLRGYKLSEVRFKFRTTNQPQRTTFSRIGENRKRLAVGPRKKSKRLECSKQSNRITYQGQAVGNLSQKNSVPSNPSIAGQLIRAVLMKLLVRIRCCQSVGQVDPKYRGNRGSFHRVWILSVVAIGGNIDYRVTIGRIDCSRRGIGRSCIGRYRSLRANLVTTSNVQLHAGARRRGTVVANSDAVDAGARGELSGRDVFSRNLGPCSQVVGLIVGEMKASCRQTVNIGCMSGTAGRRLRYRRRVIVTAFLVCLRREARVLIDGRGSWGGGRSSRVHHSIKLSTEEKWQLGVVD